MKKEKLAVFVIIFVTGICFFACDDDSDEYADDRVQCVEKINAYRATLDLPPYEQWTEAEPCSDSQAKKDSETGTPHGAFGQCDEWAQNECPKWDSVESVLTQCLQMMWDEGPGEPFSDHGHYLNMSSDKYSRVACGFYKTADGKIWSVQNFN